MRTVEQLKREARRTLQEYRAAADGFDCGSAMAQTVSVKVAQLAREFDALMERLEQIDPTCPKDFRLTAR